MDSQPDPGIQQMASTICLPYDVMALVVGKLDWETLKQIRFCSDWLAREAARYCFSTIHVSMHLEGLERISGIARSSRTAHAVKKLVLRRANTPSETVISDTTAEAQREEKQDETEAFTWPTPNLSTWLRASGAVQKSRVHKAYIGLEEALVRLPNLQTLVTKFDLYWPEYSPLHHADYGLEEWLTVRDRSAHLAFILRALGKRNSFSNSLTELKLRSPGYTWWGLGDLDRALEPTDDTASHENRRLMENAFSSPKHLRISIGGRQSEMATCIEAVARFLGKCSNLTRLKFKILFSHGLAYRAPDMLTGINACVSWPALSHLSLERVRFRKESILRTLSLVSPTLKSLVLDLCFLMDEECSWSDVHREMRLIDFHPLLHLDLRVCYQEMGVPPGALHVSPQDLSVTYIPAGPRASYGANGYDLLGYPSNVCDYILKRTDSMPPLLGYRRG
ncbi:uncharacterized protein BKCO1_25000131 [Diplodia corticola]|uniref:Uncharacterized protein n=1 Tax=Diplodia corticola TaxID=236234 RepID=A0A1J9RNQ0_9PEZI|nr:uncharacterized protein BKCO1_25000131 [Diplodia corticola]OJD34171.1 hypothetical protein BKCO1_25000131 [Diplodia corticola]